MGPVVLEIAPGGSIAQFGAISVYFSVRDWWQNFNSEARLGEPNLFKSGFDCLHLRVETAFLDYYSFFSIKS